MGCDRTDAELKNRSKCFNPRTRMGCDSVASIEHENGSVSIHAPARGATVEVNHVSATTIVSIHAPARGATYLKRQDAQQEERFNPRTRTGCDKRIGGVCRSIRVSIHAPARGATPTKMLSPPKSVFQSTHPHGVRQAIFLLGLQI